VFLAQQQTSGSAAGSRHGTMLAGSSFDGKVKSNSSVNLRSQSRSSSGYLSQIFPRSLWKSLPSCPQRSICKLYNYTYLCIITATTKNHVRYLLTRENRLISVFRLGVLETEVLVSSRLKTQVSKSRDSVLNSRILFLVGIVA